MFLEEAEFSRFLEEVEFYSVTGIFEEKAEFCSVIGVILEEVEF